ncbi:hypothetical protein Leryth_009380 [Lithospermum erythrorhizon]|nr:hypothetical protein Leryth_009380 [Lithospermum erythrorhizon]
MCAKMASHQFKLGVCLFLAFAMICSARNTISISGLDVHRGIVVVSLVDGGDSKGGEVCWKGFEGSEMVVVKKRVSETGGEGYAKDGTQTIFNVGELREVPIKVQRKKLHVRNRGGRGSTSKEREPRVRTDLGTNGKRRLEEMESFFLRWRGSEASRWIGKEGCEDVIEMLGQKIVD